MDIPRNGERNEVINRLVAVAIDKDKESQVALKWATNNLLNRGQTVVLVHVNVKPSGYPSSPSLNAPRSANGDLDPQKKEFFLPFRCFCDRKDIQCQDVLLKDTDVVNALVEFVTHSAIEILVLGASPKGFKETDIPGSVSKGVPDFCTVYVISEGKISSTRSASRPAPAVSPLRDQLLCQASCVKSDHLSEKSLIPQSTKLSSPDTDISYVSSGRPSVDRIFYDSFEMSQSPQIMHTVYLMIS